MTRFVLDCSVTMGWCFESEADAYARNVLDSLVRAAAIVPSLWPLEVANVLLVAERRRRIGRADSTRFLELIGQLPVTVARSTDLQEVPGLVALGRERGLSAYDAAYLHLALQEGLPLATRDRGLRTAARAAGVPVFAPSVP
jgi:predicted nucleic acid-binding protein